MADKKFSVIIPTYTGAGTIAQCFESIASQRPTRPTYEVVVVIDGKNDEISKICEKYRQKIERRAIKFSVIEFAKNQGRFIARLEGARKAQFTNLLFVDDRITFDKNYFKAISELDKPIVLPNAIESEASNFISHCLFLLRKRVYGSDKFGLKFDSHYINKTNFEASPKGTTSLWIQKDIFVDACRKLEKEVSKNNKYTNEDTKLFKIIIDRGLEIYRYSETRIYYHSRARAWSEIKHLYARGPRFVDYYMHPGTRFFPLLVSAVLAGLGLVAVSILRPEVLIWVLLVSLAIFALVSFLVMKKVTDLPKLILGLPIIVGTFSLGIYKGIFILLSNKIGDRFAAQ